MLLGKTRIKGSELAIEESGAEVLHVEEPHSLVMAAGYLKFILAQSPGEDVYFRGQRKLYGSLRPTLYRDLKSRRTQEKRHNALAGLINQFRVNHSIFSRFGDYAHEALLQHYGVSTSWIDLVDNVWVALWFACHRAMSIGKGGQFIHFEKRRPTTSERFAYLLLVATDITQPSPHRPGYYSGSNTELVDLRMAAPSIFLRPHAQHGLLFRKKGGDGGRSLDYSDQIRGVIRVDLHKAVDWLGVGTLVNSHSLFPPPFYDHGYQILLSRNVNGDPALGAIAHVGA